MANIERLIPHILNWEVGLKDSEKNLAPRQMYESVAKRGYHCISGDNGGDTMCGVTLLTFKEWRQYNGQPTPTTDDLKALRYDEWLAILRHYFWNRCKADRIDNNSIAVMMVDWCWLNDATTAIRQMQSAFGLVTDGIIGAKSLAALNATPASEVFSRLETARERSYEKIVASRPSQKKFLNGWLNRTRSIAFGE